MYRKWMFAVMLTGSLLTAQSQNGSTYTDQMVATMIQQQVVAGRSEQEIQKELTKKGVTPAQLMRVVNQMKADRAESRKNEQVFELSGTPMDSLNLVTEPTEEMPADTLLWQKEEKPLEEQVFGHRFFQPGRISFESPVNMSAPAGYRLGPGDIVEVTLWGENEHVYQATLDNQGCALFEGAGLLPLGGLTSQEAEIQVRAGLQGIYAGLSEGTTSLRLTARTGRSIQVSVMGEVNKPGVYGLSAYATLFHAVYRAGGLDDLAGIRQIQLVRNGKTIAEVDAYNYLLKGASLDGIRLQDGDAIVIPAYQALVKVTGAARRPMYYEMLPSETLEDLIKYAGGLSANAYRKSYTIERQGDNGLEVYTIKAEEAKSFGLADGDQFTVGEALDRYQNRLEVRGAVRHPGLFQYTDDLKSVKQLLLAADGLEEDAFPGRAVLYRKRSDMTSEAQSVDVIGILNGTAPDVALRNNDMLWIPSVLDLQETEEITIEGEVFKPGRYRFAAGMTVEDLVMVAGGLQESASLNRVDVSRRVVNQDEQVSDTLSHLYSFKLKEGLVIDGTPGFQLAPNDWVMVRRNPGYVEQQNVTIEGEITYSGTYSLTCKNERLSDLVSKAGGVTSYAYVKGARLVRKANESEIRQMEQVISLINKELGKEASDSLQLKVDSLITVGIDLAEALRDKGGDADLVLREGDRLIVPQVDNTVKIDGGVMYPNTVSFESGLTIKDYISQAGGYASAARKSGAFIIYMNGKVDKVKGNGRNQIRPGCRIIVPLKGKKGNMVNTLAMLNSMGSFALMAASVANLIK